MTILHLFHCEEHKGTIISQEENPAWQKHLKVSTLKVTVVKTYIL